MTGVLMGSDHGFEDLVREFEQRFPRSDARPCAPVSAYPAASRDECTFSCCDFGTALGTTF